MRTEPVSAFAVSSTRRETRLERFQAWNRARRDDPAKSYAEMVLDWLATGAALPSKPPELLWPYFFFPLLLPFSLICFAHRITTAAYRRISRAAAVIWYGAQ